MQNSFNDQMVMKAAADKAGMTDQRGTLGEQGPDTRNDLIALVSAEGLEPSTP